MITSRQKSPIRYPGGKQRMLPIIRQAIPNNDHWHTWKEPFFGGGSVGLHAKTLFPDKTFYFNELDATIFSFWLMLRDRPDELVSRVRSLKASLKTEDIARDWYNTTNPANGRQRGLHDGSAFPQEYPGIHVLSSPVAVIRARNFDEPPNKKPGWQPRPIAADFDPMERAVNYYVANRVSISGNTATGGFSRSAFEGRFTDEMVDRLLAFSEILQGVHLSCGDWSQMMMDGAWGFDKPLAGTLFFLDPPYPGPANATFDVNAVGGRLYPQGFDLETFLRYLPLTYFQGPPSWLMTIQADEGYLRSTVRFFNKRSVQVNYSMTESRRGQNTELLLANYTLL